MKPYPYLAAMLLFGFAASADAHAILVESSPAINASAPAGRLAIRLRFNSRIDAARSRLTLVSANGDSRPLALEAAGSPDELAAHTDATAGTWRLRWLVLSTDGHITRGDVPFTVTMPH